MAVGDLSAVNHGTYALSGSGIITAITGINLPPTKTASGSAIHIVPTGLGSAELIEVIVA